MRIVSRFFFAFTLRLHNRADSIQCGNWQVQKEAAWRQNWPLVAFVPLLRDVRSEKATWKKRSELSAILGQSWQSFKVFSASRDLKQEGALTEVEIQS